MNTAAFIVAVRAAVSGLELPAARRVISETNAQYRLAVASHAPLEKRGDYLSSLHLRVATEPHENRRKVEIPDKKREADSPLKTVFSIHHLNLAYWMGRTLGEATRTLEDWQVAVHRVCGSHTPLGDMTEEQCRDVLVASGLFTPTTVPSNTEHMTQRIN